MRSGNGQFRRPLREVPGEEALRKAESLTALQVRFLRKAVQCLQIYAHIPTGCGLNKSDFFHSAALRRARLPIIRETVFIDFTIFPPL